MRPYELNDPELNRLIRELIDAAGGSGDADLVAELITTAIKLQRDGADRGELKLMNTALKEMRYSNLVFTKYRDVPKVTVFGSARTEKGDPNYELTVRFGKEMAQRGWMVVTGAGPGIMQAANEGAGSDKSIGVNIRLPFEADANPHIENPRLINFKYFFTRKLGFVKESHAFALFPGGFGTMDEVFELLTLVQTGKSDLHPIVMIEAEGSTYWQTWTRFVHQDLLGNGLISESDLNLFEITSDVEVAADEICHFYANYHSQRYVDGRLVLRLLHQPSPETVTALNEDFADILTDGTIELIDPTPAELRDGDALECSRLALAFNRRDIGRLRQLVDQLNDLVKAEPAELHPPPRFTP
ncbi:MAG: TIGR00730 family Rossman fold protein [Acidimicrobiia bacterium]